MPVPKGLYKVQVDNRNAYWQYEYVGVSSVRVKFGRIGTDNAPKEKDYGSPYKRDREIEKLIAEKLGKGYRPETEEGLKKEIEVAEALGQQRKIQHLYYVQERIGNTFRFGKDYYPAEGIVVEVLNSWDKSTAFLHLTKTDSVCLEGVTVAGNGCSFARTVPNHKSGWVSAIRKYIKDTAETVKKIVTIQFGMVGRKLSLGDDPDQEEETQMSEVIEAMKSQNVGGGMGDQVLMSFAALGARVLDLD